MPTFTEIQKNPFRWYLAAFAVVVLVVLYWAIHSTTYVVQTKHYLLVLGACSIPIGFLMLSAFRKTIYRIDGQEIRYCVKPLGTWQTIRWADIDRAYVQDFTLVGEHPKGFVGARKRRNGWPYVINLGPDSRIYDFKGDFGLQINKKTGGKILLGTQRPDELQVFLATLPVSQPAKTI